jgi:predicted amidohydrolase
MDESKLTRRAIIAASAAGAMLAARTIPNASAAPAPVPNRDGPAPFKVAVMRVPVIVPTSPDVLIDVRNRNTEAMIAAIESVMKGPGPKPRLIVFPVLQLVSSHRAVSGVPISAVAVDLMAQPLDKSVFAPVLEACRRHDCYIATSTQEKTERMPGRFFHTGFIIGPDGLVLRSPKTQAKSAPEISYLRDVREDYKRAFGPDSILPVARTPIGTLGCYIESEAIVPEAARLLASRGAQIIVHPSLEDDETPWQAMKQAIGYQCGVYVVSGTTSRNVSPKEPNGGWCGGASTIVGPDGAVIASMGGHEEGHVTGMIDLAAATAAKAANVSRITPAWGLYKELYAQGA